MQTEARAYKKKWGPAEGKRRNRRLKECALPAPGCMWQKAVSKNPDERKDGREGLSLLFLLFEDMLDLKADHDGDPLEDLEIQGSAISKLALIEEFVIRPRHTTQRSLD